MADDHLPSERIRITLADLDGLQQRIAVMRAAGHDHVPVPADQLEQLVELIHRHLLEAAGR